jgi:hypothetical protein
MFRKDTFSTVHAVGARPKIYGRKSAVPASIDGAALLPQQCRQTSKKNVHREVERLVEIR